MTDKMRCVFSHYLIHGRRNGLYFAEWLQKKKLQTVHLYPSMFRQTFEVADEPLLNHHADHL
jgi:hypothetical protein